MIEGTGRPRSSVACTLQRRIWRISPPARVPTRGSRPRDRTCGREYDAALVGVLGQGWAHVDPHRGGTWTEWDTWAGEASRPYRHGTLQEEQMTTRLRITAALAVVVILCRCMLDQHLDAVAGSIGGGHGSAGHGSAGRIRPGRIRPGRIGARYICPVGGSCAGGPDRLHRAGHGTRRRQAVQRQASDDPDAMDRWRGRRLRRRRRRLRGRDRHRRRAGEHRIAARSGAAQPHRRQDAARPGDAGAAGCHRRVRRARSDHGRGHVHGSGQAQRGVPEPASVPSCSAARTARSTPSRSRSTSSPPSGIPSRPSRRPGTKCPRRGTR